MIFEFAYTFKELEITIEDVRIIMGFEPETNPEDFNPLIAEAIQKANTICNAEGGFAIFSNCNINMTGNTVQISNQLFHPDKIVVSQLKEAQKIAVFVCTAGKAIVDAANKAFNDGDLFLGYTFDSIGSVVADKTAKKLEQELERMVSTDSLKISDRFSPGYCEWDVAEQHQLFSLLPPHFCGAELTSSALMQPVKSVSGIIGIGKNLSQKGLQCHWCNDKKCYVGKINRLKKDEKK